MATSTPRRGTDWSVVGAVVASLVALAITVAIVFAMRDSGPGEEPDAGAPFDASSPGYALPVELPPAAAQAGIGATGGVDPEWVAVMAERTGIPPRALAAYGGAAIFKAADRPDCGLSWTTLAGIGSVESDHGRHGGSTIGEDGTVVPPIFGVSLRGDGTARIPDSDGGTIDGDVEYDRAVGPMQLIPATWRNWHVDGGGDGVEDPQNIDDAVVAAANYLCRASPDMASEGAWRTGVGAYNPSTVYIADVASAANRYALAAEQITAAELAAH